MTDSETFSLLIKFINCQIPEIDLNTMAVLTGAEDVYALGRDEIKPKFEILNRLLHAPIQEKMNLDLEQVCKELYGWPEERTEIAIINGIDNGIIRRNTPQQISWMIQEVNLRFN